MSVPASIKQYLSARAIEGPWKAAGALEGKFSGAVVIPALAEYEHLFSTLASLECNPSHLLSRYLVLVVVNNREDAATEEKENNFKTLAKLSSCTFPLLNLAWVDAASPGLELPAKSGGVGLARRIGLDAAIPFLDHSSDPLLICLDADTTVSANYLPDIESHFRGTSVGGAVIPFVHRQGATVEEQLAIERYELFLRAYVFGLSLASSPYAFHTVGSAMACRASAYIRMGGMNTRKAGEDFYFLQQLFRTAGIARVQGATVHPSPRPSWRVPFGTGRSVSRILDGGPAEILFYHPGCFVLLGKWLSLAEGSLDMDGAEVLAAASAISPDLGQFLHDAELEAVWDRLKRNNPDHRRRSAFHGWFDGFKTLKLVHYLSAGPYPRCDVDEALSPLLQWAGLATRGNVTELLVLLRQLQQ